MYVGQKIDVGIIMRIDCLHVGYMCDEPTTVMAKRLTRMSCHKHRVPSQRMSSQVWLR